MTVKERLGVKEKVGNCDTYEHILKVQRYLNDFIRGLLNRSENHDQSKLKPPESAIFAEFSPMLENLTYGSPEFNAVRKEMKSALDHHYTLNQHHPEHWKNGIEDMSLLDLIEMFCDWKASSQRHNDGNILKSIEINGNRFGMSPQLIKIFENTAVLFESK